jgi:S1-C subfamily serine protease
VFFLNGDETIYGRYGGRDAASAEGRLSMKGLHFAMQHALDAHKAPPAPEALPGKPVRVEDFAAASRHKGCIHCHNINEFRRADLKAMGKWQRDSIWVYPLPENVGITLDVNECNRVKAVRPDSSADRAGLKPGDALTRLNGSSVASLADVMYALHKAPGQGAVNATWLSGGKERSGTLELSEGWRKTNLTWRPSMLDLLPGVPFSGDDLTAKEKQSLGLPEKQAVMRQDSPVHSSLKAIGLKEGDVVVGFDGKTVDGASGDLLGFVRRNYLVGDTLTVNVLRAGKPMELKLVLK